MFITTKYTYILVLLNTELPSTFVISYSIKYYEN